MNSNLRWLQNDVQFPRLIAEILATQELNLSALTNSMDVTQEELNELFERAQRNWEVFKKMTTTPNPSQKIFCSVDGGESYLAVSDVKVIVQDVSAKCESGTNELHITSTAEGLILDVWVTSQFDPEGVDTNVGTQYMNFEDIVHRITSKS